MDKVEDSGRGLVDFRDWERTGNVLSLTKLETLHLVEREMSNWHILTREYRAMARWEKFGSRLLAYTSVPTGNEILMEPTGRTWVG